MPAVVAGCARLCPRHDRELGPGCPGELAALRECVTKVIEEPMDKIFIRALKTEAIIGIFDWERQIKQTVLIDIEMSANIRKAALTDSIEDTLNYKRVAKRAKNASNCKRKGSSFRVSTG